jgi:hypothetical protein
MVYFKASDLLYDDAILLGIFYQVKTEESNLESFLFAR